MQCDGQEEIYNFRALMRIAGPLVRIAVRTFWTRDRDRKAHIARKGSPSLPFSSQHLMGRHGAVHAALNELSPRTAEKPFRGTSASCVQSPFRACAGGGVGLHWLGPFPLGCTLSSHSGYLSNIQVTRPSIQGKGGGGSSRPVPQVLGMLRKDWGWVHEGSLLDPAVTPPTPPPSVWAAEPICPP